MSVSEHFIKTRQWRSERGGAQNDQCFKTTNIYIIYIYIYIKPNIRDFYFERPILVYYIGVLFS